MIQTRKSNPNRPPRILIYGVEGCGKSTFGAKSDSPVFITPEGGTDQVNPPVEEMQNVTNWDGVKAAVETLINEKHDFKTLVIDSADWIEGLCHKKIIGTSGKSIITCNGGYGTGYRESQKMHAELIERISFLRTTKDMNIIVTAHSHVKPVKDPSILEDYDQFEIKCHEFVSSLWREWVDALFFVRFRTFVKASEDTSRARALSDGTRVVYATKQPAFQAKNRYSMPAEMDFTLDFWTEMKGYTSKDSKEKVLEDIKTLSDRIPDKGKLVSVAEAIAKAGEDLDKLRIIRNRLLSTLKKGAT